MCTLTYMCASHVFTIKNTFILYTQTWQKSQLLAHRFLGQFSIDFYEIWQGLFSSHPPNTVKFSFEKNSISQKLDQLARKPIAIQDFKRILI